MSEILWKIGEDHQLRDYCIAQDMKFQEAMRAELNTMARERGKVLNFREPAKPKEVVRDIIVLAPPPNHDELIPAERWKIIFHEVCDKHKVSATLIRGAQRARYIVKARQEMAYRLATETEMSLPQIARHMGYKDHSSLYHCFDQYKKDSGIV